MSTTPRYDAALADELNVANPQELHRAHERTLLALLEVEQELAQVRRLLAHAVAEADGWHDDSRGGPITDDPLMNEARAAIAKEGAK